MLFCLSLGARPNRDATRARPVLAEGLDRQFVLGVVRSFRIE